MSRPSAGKASPRPGADASPAGVAGMAHDADSRNANIAAAQYANLDRGFVAFAETAISPVITTTLDGTITTWNPAAERLYGYAAAEAIGMPIGTIIPPDQQQQFGDAVGASLDAHSGEAFETVRVAKAGRRIDVLLMLSAITSPAGETIGIINITRDLTPLKAAERRFRLAVESCPNGMMMSDRAGTIVMVNKEIERLFGCRREELIGRSIEDLLPERLRGRHVRHRDAFAGNPQHRHMDGSRELVGARKDGTEIPIEVGLTPIETPEGLMVLSAIVDISERKRLDRLKDEFVSMVSHELRTPLTSISGALGLLMEDAGGHLPDTAMQLLTIVHANSQRLVRLINDILDLQKIEAGQIAFHLRYVSLRSVVEQTIEANHAFADGFGVRLRVDGARCEDEVLADPDRLAQVLTNLLANAIKFSPPGEEVVVAIARRGGDMRVSVRDHGPGIPEAFKSRIFEKFAQADSSHARQKGGTGLGLSIAKQLVHHHGGSLGFEAAPGGGTVFYFDLPCESDPALTDGSAGSDRAVGCAAATARGRCPGG
jgi:PAS domain S-box-containing protein